MLRTGALVAWLSEGSCTDQVASATAAMPAMPSSAAPMISCMRRRNAARSSSETDVGGGERVADRRHDR